MRVEQVEEYFAVMMIDSSPEAYMVRVPAGGPKKAPPNSEFAGRPCSSD